MLTDNDIIKTCKQYSMISHERFQANVDSVKYVEEHKIPGDIVEIGVWKGGSILSMILKYEQTKILPREIHLYDTFEGMTPSTDIDIDQDGNKADDIIGNNEWFNCACQLDEVKENIGRYTKLNPQYHVGDILKNTYFPEQISILRIDTDWYESTKYELDNFYQLVSPGGVVMVDDYGYWQGCKQAVDEFLEKHENIKTHMIDSTGMIFYKPT